MAESKKLILLRHVSGAGSSTFAQFLRDTLSCKVECFEADQWMINDKGEYDFKRENLGFCHKKCYDNVEQSMIFNVPIIILSNTSTTEKEIFHYLDLAKTYNYQVVSLVVENRHGGKDLHGVPESTRVKQQNNLLQSLKLR